MWPGPDAGAAYDLKTGKPAKDLIARKKVESVGSHTRCYRSKATVNYLLGAYLGIELFDLHGEDHSRNNWVRGTCQYGFMPANGLIYAPPHACACFMEAKLFGFYALAAARKTPVREKGTRDRLQRGPAYGKIANCKTERESSSWPTFRCDAMRRGVSQSTVQDGMKPVWSIEAGERISPPVVSGGVVIVSDIEAHTIRAFHEADGKERWTFTAGGRVDSAPTIAGDAVVFGCLDGNVYCLSRETGELAWRFQAAPAVLNIVSRGQLASVWPVNGSILVKDGTAYFSAGRSTYLDGGLYLYAVDVKSGNLVASNHFQTETGTEHPEGGKILGVHHLNKWDAKTIEQPDHSDSYSMGGTVNDLMSTDGTSVFLHHLRFSPELEEQKKKSRHIFSTSHFLDDGENHRSHWFLGFGDFARIATSYEFLLKWNTSISIAGIMLAYEDEHAYVVDRRGGTYPQTPDYQLRRYKNKPFDPSEPEQCDFVPRGGGKESIKPEWSKGLSMRPRTIVKAGGVLVVGGMPLQEDKAHPYELVEGRHAGLIQFFSPGDGKLTGEIELPAAVVWDGIAPAGDKLFVSTVDGRLTCLAGPGKSRIQQITHELKTTLHAR